MIQVTSRGDRRQLKNNTEDIHNLQQGDIPTFERKYLQSSLKNSGGGTSGPTRAICTADAGTGNTIAATLFNTDGTTGDAVTVYCNLPSVISDLNEASPLLEGFHSIIYVTNNGTPSQRWECVQLFDATEECECTTS